MSAGGSTDTWVIVPMRGIHEGKSRLDAVLSPSARAGFNRQLLGCTLAIIGRWCGTPERCIVVSPCRETLAIAEAAGALALSEGEAAAGLNQAVALATAHAAKHGAARVLILPADLPRLSVQALRDIVATHEVCGGVVLATDLAGTGTNALVVESLRGFEFGYGAGSRARHAAAAESCALAFTVVVHPDLQFDIDTPGDLIAWRRGASRRSGAGVNMRSYNEMVEEAG